MCVYMRMHVEVHEFLPLFLFCFEYESPASFNERTGDCALIIEHRGEERRGGEERVTAQKLILMNGSLGGAPRA